MDCPLCAANGATVVTEEATVVTEEPTPVVTCEACGGQFSMSILAAEQWAVLNGATQVAALELARKRLTTLRPYAQVPLIQLHDVWAWAKSSA
jgi:hypothetical protein